MLHENLLASIGRRHEAHNPTLRSLVRVSASPDGIDDTRYLDAQSSSERTGDSMGAKGKMSLPHGSGYNAAVEGLREEEYPMLRGNTRQPCYK